ncbi:unnamed protein product [Pylaiella littoralis]
MDVLSAATETVANADAIQAAVAKAQKLPTGPASSLAAAAAAAAATCDTPISSASSPRPMSPYGGPSTSKDSAAGNGTGRAGCSEMDVDDGTAPSRSRDNGTGSPPVLPAVRAAYEALVQKAEDIKSGTHPKMVTEMETQGRLKRVRLDGAKNNKQLMEENIEELGSAEQRDKTVQTKVDLERTQDELLDDVHQRIRKAKVDGGLVPHNPPRAASSGIAAEAAGEGGDKDKDKASGGLTGKKRARLLPEQPFEKVTPEAVLAKAEARRVRTLTLSDIEMRRDFQAIIADWRDRAKKYLSTYNNSHWTRVTVQPDSFRVRGVTFARGDPVVVKSRVTGEEFHGEITVVKPKMVFLSLYGGVKTRIFVDHISTGRLTVARADATTSVA